MLLIGTPGWAELALIAFIILLLFGKNRLPGLAKSIGSGIHEFRKGISGQPVNDEDDTEETEISKKTTKPNAAKKNKSKV
jgi:sec-independent protein translocase protein TatA